jgi:hypothetical protein
MYNKLLKDLPPIETLSDEIIPETSTIYDRE